MPEFKTHDIIHELAKQRSDLPNTRRIDNNPVIALGVAVIRRALQDLTITGIRCHKQIRKDSYDFLVNRLWARGSVWAIVLSGIITKESIMSSVNKRCKLDSEGNVVSLGKK